MATLLAWDHLLFQRINGQWTNGALDVLMPAFHWGPVWFAILGPLALYAAWRFPGPTRRVLIVAAVVLLLVDQTNARLLKPLLARIRPCHVLEGVRLLVPCGGPYGLPSGHAASTAALALTLSGRFPRTLAWLAILVGLVGYSRIYVGVHFPLDVAAGWGWGLAAGFLGRGVFRLWDTRAARSSARGVPPSG